MITLIGGFGAALFVWWVLKSFSLADPKKLAELGRRGGGAAALLLAGLFAMRGRLDMAILAGGAGAWLIGWAARPGWLPWPTKRAPAGAARDGVSRVRSATLEMELDHGGGRLSGTVLAGPLAGRPLDALSPADLLAVRTICLGADPEGLRLIEAYLDSRVSGWREHAEADPHAGQRPDAKGSAMSHEEAYEILGLQPGADAEAVRRAHRSLMKRLHPDGGGSTYLAARVNQAKDVLLNRHR